MYWMLAVLGHAARLLARTQDERGQTLAEYSLLITIISVATVALAVITFRDTVAEAWNSATDCLTALGACGS